MPDVLRAPSPPPVAGVPPAELADGVAAAHRWLVSLLAAAPLERAPQVPLAALVAEGPGLAAAVLRAVGSDVQFTVYRPRVVAPLRWVARKVR